MPIDFAKHTNAMEPINQEQAIGVFFLLEAAYQ